MYETGKIETLIALDELLKCVNICTISLHPCFREKWGNVEIIVGIPLLIKAIILGIQNILEVVLTDPESKKENST